MKATIKHFDKVVNIMKAKDINCKVMLDAQGEITIVFGMNFPDELFHKAHNAINKLKTLANLEIAYCGDASVRNLTNSYSVGRGPIYYDRD